METYGGFPKPTGARMMLGVVAKPDPDAGEDAMKTRLEITEQGHILANGQRLR